MFEISPNPTCRRIMEAAELLFAQAGLEGVSLREITAAAGVNLAAINYHFYDKESLYKKLISHRLSQINEQRLERLSHAQAAAQRAGESYPRLPAIMDALARPLLVPSPELGPHAPRLIGRMLIERPASVADLIQSEFEPVMTRFGQACRRHAPGLSAEDFLWRFTHLIGALHHTALTLPEMSRLTRGICRPQEAERGLDSFIALASRAFDPSSS